MSHLLLRFGGSAAGGPAGLRQRAQVAVHSIARLEPRVDPVRPAATEPRTPHRDEAWELPLPEPRPRPRRPAFSTSGVDRRGRFVDIHA